MAPPTANALWQFLALLWQSRWIFLVVLAVVGGLTLLTVRSGPQLGAGHMLIAVPKIDRGQPQGAGSLGPLGIKADSQNVRLEQMLARIMHGRAAGVA